MWINHSLTRKAMDGSFILEVCAHGLQTFDPHCEMFCPLLARRGRGVRWDEAAIFQYINGFKNIRRRHSYPGGISPLAFEAKVA